MTSPECKDKLMQIERLMKEIYNETPIHSQWFRQISDILVMINGLIRLKFGDK